MHQLTSIAFSHYVEKARWALDRFGVAYTDHRYLPFVHFAAVYRVHRGRKGKADKASSRLSTPVLETPSGEILCDSAEILHYVSDRFAPPEHHLYPSPDVALFEQHLHDELGPHTRRVAYSVCFADLSLLRDLARHNVDRLQATLFIAALPVAVGSLRKVLHIDVQHVASSTQKVRTEMTAISEQLADGRRYLLGDRFSAADLAFACMVAPAVFPPEYSAWLPSLDRLPCEARTLVGELRATRSGQHALRMFREERRRVLPTRTA